MQKPVIATDTEASEQVRKRVSKNAEKDEDGSESDTDYEYEYEEGLPLTERVLVRDSSGSVLEAGVYWDLQASGLLGSNKLLKETIFGSKSVYVDKHVMLHRLYIGISSHFGTAQSLKTLVQKFLPITHYLVSTRAGALMSRAEAQKTQGAQDSLRAAVEAQDALKLPAFHWGLVYRL